jgi:radical SAM protein with 4Fe4S-binding SPASM domain
MKLFVTATDQLIRYDPVELLELWSTFGVKIIAVERLTSDGNAVDNPHLFPDNRVVDQWYYELYRAYKAHSWPFSISTFTAIDEKFETNNYKVDTNCRTCEQNLFTIDGSGNIGGCANGAKAESNGTINEDLDEFLMSEGRLDRITKELDHHPNCLTCHLFDVCGGDCHRLVWQGNSCPGLTKILSYLKYGEPKTIPVMLVE